MKTLAELKRDLKIGTKIKCIKHSIRPNRVGEITTIKKVLTNSLQQENGTWLDIPNASLVEYEDNIFTFYEFGTRDLTEQEKIMLDKLNNCCSKEQQERDIMTDCNSCYYTEKAFAKENDIEYLLGYEFSKGLKYDHNTKKMKDKKVKGVALYSFEILKDELGG